MEIAVPSDLPVLTDKEVRDLTTKPLYTQTERKDFEAEAKTYFETHDVIPMLNVILTDLFVAQPDDPIDHMMMYMLRNPGIAEIRAKQQANSTMSLAHIADDAVSYSTRFKLPQLCDELLTGLLEDKPEDAVRFAVSWLRWSKNNFVSRHIPEGYRNYHAAKDEASLGSSVKTVETSQT
jgi:hypothetical protein